MAKRQTRRAISVRGLTYQRMKKYCERNDKSISGFVEEIVAEKMEQLGVPEETELHAPPPSHAPEPSGLADFKGSMFTF